MIPAAISRLIILVIGTLYPAYQSYKTIRTRNIQRYVRWILYWIVYSLFICAETFADIFVSWLPFYYELKIVFVIWLVLPFTNGANILFRSLIRPQFTKWETVADNILAILDRDSLSYVLVFVTRSLHYVVNFFIERALMTHSKLADYVGLGKTGESEEAATTTRDLRQELELNRCTPTELQKNAATEETQEVFVSASDQEDTDLGHLSEGSFYSALTKRSLNAITGGNREINLSAGDHECSNAEPRLEALVNLRRNAVTEETRESIVSPTDIDCSDIKPEVESDLHSTSTEPMRKAEDYQKVLFPISDNEVNKIKAEPENKLSGATTKRKRKATGRKMKKMEVDEGLRLLTDSGQHNGEVNIRTTRAKKYICCSSKASA